MAVWSTPPESSPDSMRTLGGGGGGGGGDDDDDDAAVEQQIVADVRQMYATMDHGAAAIALTDFVNNAI